MAISPATIIGLVFLGFVIIAGVGYALRHNMQDKRKMAGVGDVEMARHENHHVRHGGQATRYPNHQDRYAGQPVRHGR